jgi:hypothetical protein
MSIDKRKHTRTPLQCKIKILHSGVGEKIVNTRNISYGGVFVCLNPEDIPPVGTIVLGQVQGMAEDAPELEMEVVRVENEGVGLRFIEESD